MIEMHDPILEGSTSPEIQTGSQYVVSPEIKPYFEAVFRFLDSIADEHDPNIDDAKEALKDVDSAASKYDEAIRNIKDISVAIKQLSCDDAAVSWAIEQFNFDMRFDYSVLEDPAFYEEYDRQKIISEREEWLTERLADFAACTPAELQQGQYNVKTERLIFANQNVADSLSLRLDAFRYRLASNSGISELWDKSKASHLAA